MGSEDETVCLKYEGNSLLNSKEYCRPKLRHRKVYQQLIQAMFPQWLVVILFKPNSGLQSRRVHLLLLTQWNESSPTSSGLLSLTLWKSMADLPPFLKQRRPRGKYSSRPRQHPLGDDEEICDSISTFYECL